MEIKIERGIPLTRTKKFGKWNTVVEKMRVGDTVLLDTRSHATSFMRAAANLGYGCTSRKQKDGQVRVWITHLPNVAVLPVTLLKLE